MMIENFERISYDISPINYDVKFRCDMKNFLFMGSLVLDVEVKISTDILKLNVKELKVTDITCGNLKGKSQVDIYQELLTIKFDSKLPVGKAQVKLNFEGIHNDAMEGFYRSKYNLPDGREVYNLSTQFESTFARRAFPCIDEPDRKATFEITLVVPDNLVAISNMPEISRKKLEKPSDLPDPEEGTSYVEVKFDKTPIMSTYLVAMVVGHFEYIEDKDANGIPIRIYTPIGKKNCGEFAMEVAKKCLPFYTKCFGVGYPLPKLDLIAIPDFAMGAMENWGLVTFREVALLIDSKQASSQNRLTVSRVVAHELAHMWFGNLVTMKWWTHLWLNEGFARWCEFLFTSRHYKEFEVWSIFASDVQGLALNLDGLKSSHPIEVPVKSPKQIDEIFDTISYAKGASIINMLFNYIGEEKFFSGLKSYMEKHKYSNTETENLWDAFSASSGENIAELMRCWTEQMGYPVVDVKKEGDCLLLKQFRYQSDGSQETSNPSTWAVPLKICKCEDNCQVLEKIQISKNVSQMKVKCSEPCIRINPGRTSFVSIKYDENIMTGIKDCLKQNKIEPIDRMSILSDLFSLAKSGQASTVDALRFSLLFRNETSCAVWSVLYSNIIFTKQIMENYFHEDSPQLMYSFQKNLNKMINYLAEPIFQRLGWESKSGENHSDKLLRSNVIFALGHAGHKKIIDEAMARFSKHYDAFMKISKGGSESEADLINPDLRTTVYSVVYVNNPQEIFTKFIELIKAAKMQDEKVRFYSLLGKVKDKKIQNKVIEYTLSDAVRKQDRYIILGSLVHSDPAARRFIWNYIKEHIKELPDQIGTNILLGRIFKTVLGSFSSMEIYKDAEAFFTENPFDCKMAIKQGLEEIFIRYTVLSRDAKKIEGFFQGISDELK